MKLVDILARELKVWPEGVVTAVQDLDGEVKFDNSHEMPRMNNSKDVWIRQGDQGDCLYPRDLAEDCSYAIVTRAQWQAVVEPLKAESRPTESMALHHQEVGRITRQWNGDGLPPVGTVCEAFRPARETWLSVKIIDRQIGSECCACRDDQDYLWWSTKFRPIRTPEQIAADEREATIKEMVYGACGCEPGDGTTTAFILCGLIYDAGYRKFEIVDN